MDSLEKIEMIQKIMDAGRAGDLLLLLEGESPYSESANAGFTFDRHLSSLCVIATYHLRFVSEFGNRTDTVKKDGKWLSPFPEKFAEWVSSGAPGITASELESYLQAYPLE